MKVSTKSDDLWTWRHTMGILLTIALLYFAKESFKMYLDSSLERRRTELRAPIIEKQNESLLLVNERLQRQNNLLWKLLARNGKEI